MKTRLSITAEILACLLIAGMYGGFSGCTSMEDGDNNGIVPKVSLSEALTKNLDSIFSDKNALAYNMKLDVNVINNSLLFVINNPQEFLEVCDDAAISTQVNFEKNCLVWGKFTSPSGSNKIAGSELAEVRKNVYTYEITMDWCAGCYANTGVHYFWSIHPKISNENVQLIIKENSDEEQPESLGTLLQAEGYVAARKLCSNGYFIVTDKDTLLTFNFPEGVFNFPENFGYDGMSITDRQSKYKVRISYEISHEDKLKSIVCTDLYYEGLLRHAVEVITKSATKID
jgi:hypothetical protein